MTIEAMKQALEALDLMYACYAHPEWISHKQQEDKILAQCASTTMTLRQAIDAAEQHTEAAVAEQHEKREPVAERFEAMHADGNVWITTLAAAALVRNAHPQPKREWVGLTDEEIKQWRPRFKFSETLVKEVEDKLRSKNT